MDDMDDHNVHIVHMSILSLFPLQIRPKFLFVWQMSALENGHCSPRSG